LYFCIHPDPTVWFHLGIDQPGPSRYPPDLLNSYIYVPSKKNYWRKTISRSSEKRKKI
jgi:hypothetical protein